MAPCLRIAVIGGGVSGITTANVLQRAGHRVVVYEKSNVPGGQWTQAYPEVSLQNTFHEYSIPSFPWPFTPALHPTGAEVLDYLHQAVRAFGIDVRLSHQVVRMEEKAKGTGWRLTIKGTGKEQRGQEGEEHVVDYDFVVVAVGHYSNDTKLVPEFPDREAFQGRVVTERDVADLDAEFKGKKVAVLGFGKSALDMATFAAEHGAQAVHHVFRFARWMIPRHISGVHSSYHFFTRFGSVMMPSWAHPTRVERFLHSTLRPVVTSFWKMVGDTVWAQLCADAAKANPGPESQAALAPLKPSNPIDYEFRVSAPLAPDTYVPLVAQGRITPHLGNIARYTQHGVILSPAKGNQGSTEGCIKGSHECPGSCIDVDVLVLAVGSRAPTFPYLPQKYRALLEVQEDGFTAQLYRHMIHPCVPNLAFAGLCGSFQLLLSVEVGAVWLAAALDGRLVLPPPDEMERSMERVRDWKKRNSLADPATMFSVNSRAQQYLDILMQDLGMRQGTTALSSITTCKQEKM